MTLPKRSQVGKTHENKGSKRRSNVELCSFQARHSKVVRGCVAGKLAALLRKTGDIARSQVTCSQKCPQLLQVHSPKVKDLPCVSHGLLIFLPTFWQNGSCFQRFILRSGLTLLSRAKRCETSHDSTVATLASGL